MQTLIDNAIAKGRQEELATSPQLLLGELILKLEAVKNKELPLFIDIEEKRPMGIDSWRGSYCELAIQTERFGSYQTDEVEKEFDDGDIFYKHKEVGKENPTVAEWIEVLKEVIGKAFTGYKGGNFLMSRNTPVWLSEYGMGSTVYFIDVKEEDEKVYLVTKEDEEE